jgi:hypothetical protein
MVGAAVGDGISSVTVDEKPLLEALQPLQLSGGIKLAGALARFDLAGGGAGETMAGPVAAVEAAPLGQPAFFQAKVQAQGPLQPAAIELHRGGNGGAGQGAQGTGLGYQGVEHHLKATVLALQQLLLAGPVPGPVPSWRSAGLGARCEARRLRARAAQGGGDHGKRTHIQLHNDFCVTAFA